MLGRGNWINRVPKDLTKNLIFRHRLGKIARRSPANRKALAEACRDDLLFFINAFVWQYNPKKKGQAAVGPFVTWPFQDEALVGPRGVLWCYEHDRSAVIEKSREMGATWLFLIFQDWLCLLHPHVQALNVSLSEKAVDSKSADSLFAKLRFMHRHLPDWLLGDVTQQELFFGFNATGSQITGEASTGRAGVGGRASVIFVDEFTKIREAKQVRERTANTADCRFFNSTHEGTGTEFAALCKTPEFVKIQFHWTQHPEKWPGAYRWDPVTNKIVVLDTTFEYAPDFEFVRTEAPLGGPRPGVRSPWYDKKCAEIGHDRGIAVELDIDPGGSVSQYFNVMELRELAAQYCLPPFWEGEISFDPDSARPEALIPLPGGKLRLWCRLDGEGRPEPAAYAAGADVAVGLGNTNSVLCLGNAETGEKVLEFANPHVGPEDFAKLAAAVCWHFKDKFGQPAKLCWESQGPGATFGKRVLELGFPNIHWRESMTVAPGLGTVSKIPGWHHDHKTRRQLLDEYRTALHLRHYVNRSEQALQECLPWFWNPQGEIAHPKDSPRDSDDPSGARVNHADRVIADALCWKMMKSLGIMQAKKKAAEQCPVGSLAWRKLLAQGRGDSEDAWAG